MDGVTCDAAAKKRLGVFYTPDATATSLARWAIRTGAESILEPSVGGGALLKAAIIRAQQLRPFQERNRPFACDVDHTALVALSNELGDSVEFYVGDFLELDAATCRKFEVVVANPPFTRNHSIEGGRRIKLRKRFGIEGAAGIWVHFLAHSMDFLAQGGRIASVVPGSALFTRYGDGFLRRMCKSFLAVSVSQLAEKTIWRGGAEERGAVILADGYGLGASKNYVKGVWPLGSGNNSHQHSFEPQAYRDLAVASRPLGDLASVSIGVVTGCNSVFLLTEEERAALGLDLDCVRLIISRARQVEGIITTSQDLVRLGRDGHKTWLLMPHNIEGHRTPVRERLAKISKHKRRSTAWLNKRNPWWRIEIGPYCDAVFTYMNEHGPRLALTDTRIICTNTLHRVVFNTSTSEIDRMGAALTFISTFGQLAGEGIGRVYGGGVLKFELTEARQMPILSRSECGDDTVLHKALHKVDAALRAGAVDGARDLADEALLPRVLGPSWKSAVAELREAVWQRRDARHNGRAVLRYR
jgi:adenine-specific DNA-methyltransferase